MYHFSLLDIGKLFSFYQTTINLSEGKGKSFRNVNSANSHKCNCHDMNWNEMDI